MIVLSTFLTALASILHMAINIYIWIIIIAALISWVSPNPFNPVVQILHKLTAPVYTLMRKTRIPTVFGGIDIAPIIIIFILQFADMFFVRLIDEMARSL